MLVRLTTRLGSGGQAWTKLSRSKKLDFKK